MTRIDASDRYRFGRLRAYTQAPAVAATSDAASTHFHSHTIRTKSSGAYFFPGSKSHLASALDASRRAARAIDREPERHARAHALPAQPAEHPARQDDALVEDVVGVKVFRVPRQRAGQRELHVCRTVEHAETLLREQAHLP